MAGSEQHPTDTADCLDKPSSSWEPGQPRTGLSAIPSLLSQQYCVTTTVTRAGQMKEKGGSEWENELNEMKLS